MGTTVPCSHDFHKISLCKCFIYQYCSVYPTNLFVPCMLQAIEEKDWPTFCDLTVADSNEMHAVCLDTFPPCVYMTDTSHAVASLLHQYNDLKTTQGNINHKVNFKITIEILVSGLNSINNESFCFLQKVNQLSYIRGHQVCYTFDAGPNACIFAPGAVTGELLALLLHAFPPAPPQTSEEYVKGIATQPAALTKVQASIFTFKS